MKEIRENPFDIKIGKIYAPNGTRRMMSFASQVKWAAKSISNKTSSYGGSRKSHVREQFFSRRVIVKISVVKMGGQGLQTQALHLSYIQRDSAAHENEKGSVFDKEKDIADADEFRKRGKDDRHQFRVIVSAEDARELNELRGFTRDLMSQMESDLGTKLDWVAANHYDTATPHTHIVISGKKDNGKNLVIPRDYISYGIRGAAEHLVNRELGPINQMEAGIKLASEVTKARLTQLDRSLLRMADANVVDISKRPERGSEWTRRLDIARLKHLSQMGLAYTNGHGKWHLVEDMEQRLTRLGERKDILKTYHRTLKQAGLSRTPRTDAIYDPFHSRAKPLAGKIIGVGIADDINDRAYVMVDSTRGHAYYVKAGRAENIEGLKRGMAITITPADIHPKPSDLTIETIAAKRNGDYSPSLHQTTDPSASPEYIGAHIRRLEAMRRAGHATRNKDGSWQIPHDYLDRARNYEKQRAWAKPVDLKIISRGPLQDLASVIGRTWLDEELTNETSIPDTGYGAEVRAALIARRQFLMQQGILENETTVLTQSHLNALEKRDLAEAAKKLSTQLGKPYLESTRQGRIAGHYRAAITRPSGKYAIIERAKDFTLVPWRDTLERNRGKAVSGIMRGNTISWTLNKGREIN